MALYDGEQIDAATMDEVEAAWEDLARRRVDIAAKVAAALEKRLGDVVAFIPADVPSARRPRRGRFWRS